MKGLLKVAEIKADINPEETGKLTADEIASLFTKPTTGEILSLFTVTTGPSLDRKDTKAIEAAIKKLIPYAAIKDNLNALDALLKISCLNNLVTAYNENKVSPRLRELLEVAPPNWQEMPENKGKSWNQVIFDMIQDGRADFSKFKDQKVTDNWLLAFKITYRPFPCVDTDIKTLAEELKKRKADVKKRLAKSIEIEVAQDPGAKEQVTALMDLIDARYDLHTTKKTPLYFSSLSFRYYSSPDFYLNPATGEITDLRPYSAEIRDLLNPESWEYLKEFTTAGRKATKKKEKKETPKKSIFDKAFIKMFNATPTNDITTLNTSKSGRPGEENGIFERNIFTEEWEYKKGGTELNLPVKTLEGNTLPPAFTTSTWKTMHFLSLLFSAQNSQKGDNITPVIETSVKEYMAATGRNITANTVKETTKTIKKDLELLNEIKIKYNDKKYSLSLVRPFPGVHLNRGKIRVTLDSDFAWYLAKTTGFLMNYPAALLKLKENNSNLYPLGYKLALNRSNDANIRRGKANILSVPVCLEFCPGIPGIEKVRKEGKGGSPVKRIIEPFEKALDALQQQGVLEHWEYCLPKGEPLEQPVVTDYNYFSSLYILYEIKDFPIKNELPRIQAAAERRQKKQERLERFTEKEIAKKRATATINT